ncbi:MAG TPA: thioredoxin domain-containing protein [Thioalkalivibrio sp.]|nr:thioredoxin domain-containing protein [Thioalkalivibrio sp.]
MTHRNRLADETSPYLQQHAGNPVDWYPWGEEALEKARREDRPILLSIGYSACHWCHVMAHESFEDEATAALMNRLYVNIKVDREERPDLDKLYQVAHSLLTQRAGGWPLTMFLTPNDQMPFFGGTYFPRQARYGLPGFGEILERVAGFYHEKRDEITTQNDSMRDALARIYDSRSTDEALNSAALDQARAALAREFDARFGGFGSAPKFPHPAMLDRLLRHWAGSQLAGQPDEQALHMVRFTLTRMARGGVFDQLGGGFCRYSVDDYWMIPHFEKMLYDNGPLLALYSELFAATGDGLAERTARETADWVLREMQSPEGGYYSTLDADSEGEEGKFYVWDAARVRELLNDDDWRILARHYGLDRPPNFEGRWHLHVFEEAADIARALGLDEEQVRTRLDRARSRLLEVRAKRIRPGRDEKVLTAWNGLMIKGMAAAARHLDAPEYAESATRALDFIRQTLWRDDRLLATYKDGKAHLSAYLDDHAFLLDGILELLQVRWRSEDLAFARELADVLLAHFEDREHGGFWFTADDHEQLIQRPKSLADEATPSGNGVATQALARLGFLLGEERYLQAADRALKQAAASMNQAPSAHSSLLTAFEEQLFYPQILILRGAGEALADWQRMANRAYAPRRLSFAIPAGTEDLPPALATKQAPGNGPVAYVCKGMSCSAPIREREGFEKALEETTLRA